MRKRLNGSGFELGVVYGQRRIGKTSLILEAVKGFRHLYFLSREDSYQNNLAYFSREYRAFTKLPFVPAFDSFDELFDAAIESAGNEKLALVIDELPFLAKAYPGIVSYLQGLADRLKREGKDIKLILSGSDMSFMIDLLEDRGKPLYQRSTFKIHVGPMVFSDAIRMLDGVSGLEKAKYLSIFG
ncbi:MAG: ATP-binding protein, partial [Bacilli bacterium]|nr:ATP-binding protein [Bacilli bacterium]